MTKLFKDDEGDPPIVADHSTPSVTADMSPAQVESLGLLIEEYKRGVMADILANNPFQKLFGK